MADENFVEPIHNLIAASGISPEGKGAPAPRPRTTGIVGRVVAIHRRHASASAEPHVLDVTVGGEDYTEIVIRVPTAPYAQIEGRRAVIYLQDLPEQDSRF
ncbi:MAG: hypothetical protein IT368_01660 [Candidatus Hydrogenedentes bacterium]|nr:hypothetical protein [Candidatus Hydrogenedentota bacterium]